MRLGIAQINSTVGDFVQNARKITNACSALENVDLIVTPELSFWGYPTGDLIFRSDLRSEAMSNLDRLTQDLKDLPPVLVGTVIESPSEFYSPFLNAAVLIHRGKWTIASSKRCLPYYDIFNENRLFQSGSGPSLIKLEAGNVLVSICEDLWLRRDYENLPDDTVDPFSKLNSEYNADCHVNLSASPYFLGKTQTRVKLGEKLSANSKVPIIVANRVGAEENLIFDGGSFATNGRETSLLPVFQEGSAIFDTQRPIKSEITPRKSDSSEITEALIFGIREYFQKTGFSKACLGLSGGIDSAVVLVIAAKALGPENVTALAMPTKYNLERSTDDALKLAHNLGCPARVIPIEKLRVSYMETLTDIFGDTSADNTEENIQSRIRGNILMAFSNKSKSLALTTGNKSELATGYCTLYGDTVGALAPIGDLWKTQVFEIAEEINREKEIIPRWIIDRPPSAELRENQKDSDSLPDYKVLDPILSLIVEHGAGKSLLKEKGFSPEIIDRIFKLLKISEFKRRQYPPTLRVSQKPFLKGWDMPLTTSRYSI